MSFIDESNGRGFEPGYFLANNEDCTRVTKQMAQDSDLVVTADDGSKYIPMGSAYPSNDANAIGIVYEDVDVTAGDMPGSVVTKGEVYKERLRVSSPGFASVSPAGTENPKACGWYEKDSSNNYFLTTDVEVDSNKTYYVPDNTTITVSCAGALESLGFKFVDLPKVIR